jgi:hypothetical protein
VNRNRVKIEFLVMPRPGYTAIPVDGELCIVEDANNSRNVLVDADTVANALLDLLDGRPDTAEHFGYGTFWTLSVVQR